MYVWLLVIKNSERTNNYILIYSLGSQDFTCGEKSAFTALHPVDWKFLSHGGV